MNLLVGRTANSRRCTITMILAAMVATLCMAIAGPAQAHVPYLAKAWGLNLRGQLGDGSSTGPEECLPEQPCSTTPVGVSGLSGVTAIAGGEEHSLALLGNGTVRDWGDNEFGQLGDGSSGEVQPESDVPVAVGGLGAATSVAAGARHSLALLQNSTVMAWGNDESGQLGDGRAGPQYNRDRPIEAVMPGLAVTAIAAGEEHSLALLENGTVMAWGNDESGQLGDGGKVRFRSIPAVVKGVSGLQLTGVVAIAAGEEHSLALLGNGTVVAWGSNNHGQLGTGTTTGPQLCEWGACSITPVAVSGLSGVTAIAAGGNHSLAVLKNGTVMAWGSNGYGQLGNAGTTNSDVPVAVSGLSGVTAIAAGEEHSLALLQNGTVVAWGANGEGQLGDGTSSGPEKCGASTEEEACSTTPVAVSGLSEINVKGIAAGSWHSLAFGPPLPTVTAVSPKEGSQVGGTLVTITGTEFTGATAVTFGSTNAIVFKVESASSITAVSPPGTGAVDVTVTTPEGTSLTNSADRFSYGPLTEHATVSGVSPSNEHLTPRSEIHAQRAHATYKKRSRHEKRGRKLAAERNGVSGSYLGRSG
jgi:alpha-tubulin suppressor-like RCC1 family protein